MPPIKPTSQPEPLYRVHGGARGCAGAERVPNVLQDLTVDYLVFFLEENSLQNFERLLSIEKITILFS